MRQNLQLYLRCLAICCFCSLMLLGEESFSVEKRVITIGVLDSSLSATDKSAIAQTLEALKRLPRYKFDVQYYNPSELEDQLIRKRLDYFIGTSGFYRRFQSFGLRSVATLFTEVAPNPRYATGSVFVVRNNSPIKNISGLKGKTALASWSNGFSSFYTPMGEIYKQGFDPESFFSAYKTYGPPMSDLLQKLDKHEGDVVLMRACLLEDLEKAQPDLFKRYRVLNEKKDNFLRCKHSTDLYPNWTLVATPLAPWTKTREITKCLLNIPDSAGFGWATVPDFNTIDELYKSLKVGPYAYLRIQTVQDFIYRYRFLLLFALFCILMLCVHSWRTNVLVRRRTQSLRIAYEKEAELRRKVRESEQRIDQLQKTEIIGAMSSLIAHEINGPLATIDNYCRGIKRKLEVEENDNSWLDRPISLIAKQTAKISDVVSRVRAYAKRDEPEFTTIEADKLLKTCVSDIRMRYPNCRIVLSETEPAVVLGHVLEFEVLLENVIKNSIQAAQAADTNRIEIRQLCEGSAMYVRILNASSVRSSEELEKHLQPLHSSKNQGLGIGLLICRTIAEKMRGNLSVTYKDGEIFTEVKIPLFVPREKENADQDC
ncbi:PhnD/SsuA/transferrin family substrate-binding protein [uncultured Parasutterella sp.]|uniref:sensor histidine kinase n=1 Tax=uncultured Parasutterella sp. TaxID=1263098 RepID=UPI0025E985B0|nr:PhnD/SsuA/transferrin family substrate-binding protein [uncultured Parasutterella sp.]